MASFIKHLQSLQGFVNIEPNLVEPLQLSNLILFVFLFVFLVVFEIQSINKTLLCGKQTICENKNVLYYNAIHSKRLHLVIEFSLSTTFCFTLMINKFGMY